MALPSKPQVPAAPPSLNVPRDPYPPYRRIYTWVFQAWLIMFLCVICGALIFYLLSYIPK
jgi:hypothetical protein